MMQLAKARARSQIPRVLCPAREQSFNCVVATALFINRKLGIADDVDQQNVTNLQLEI
jgi:hypothetical protein